MAPDRRFYGSFSCSSSQFSKSQSSFGSHSSRRSSNDLPIIAPGYLVCVINTQQFRNYDYQNPFRYLPQIFGHPAVVLRVQGETVTCALITSLGGKKFETKSPHVRMQHIPISPTSPHYHTGEQLRLEEGVCDKSEDSYVKIHEVFEFPKRILLNNADKQSGLQLRFTERSFNYLAEAAKQFRWDQDFRNNPELPWNTSRPFSCSEVAVGKVRREEYPGLRRSSYPCQRWFAQDKNLERPQSQSPASRSPIQESAPAGQPQDKSPPGRQENDNGKRPRGSLGETTDNTPPGAKENRPTTPLQRVASLVKPAINRAGHPCWVNPSWRNDRSRNRRRN